MPTELGRVLDVGLLLLGGAGGVLLVWLLDGWRQRRRDRQRLTAACLVVGMEMAGNVAQADQWAALPERMAAGEATTELQAGPVEMRSAAWERSQVDLANGLPREAVIQLGAAYELAALFAHNAPAAMRRGHLVNDDLLLAIRVRDTFQAALRSLQAFERDRLGVRFEKVPVGPAEERAARPS